MKDGAFEKAINTAVNNEFQEVVDGIKKQLNEAKTGQANDSGDGS